jgi:hypothetical protein
MQTSKKHPCNAFNGWLYVPAPMARVAMEQQLRFRDQELKVDRHASGEPAAFRQWAINQVRQHADQPMIANQIEQRRQQLHVEQERLQSKIAAAVAHLDGEAERLADQLAILDQLTGQHNESSITTEQPE